jgi:hypothetical protein
MANDLQPKMFIEDMGLLSYGKPRPRREYDVTSAKEEHNGRQRRQKEQREGPETEGNQTSKGSKRQEGQTSKSALK